MGFSGGELLQKYAELVPSLSIILGYENTHPLFG